MTNVSLPLAELGWSAHFQRQLSAEESDTSAPVRVLAVHRSSLDVAGAAFAGRVATFRHLANDEDQPAVGDWLLIDAATKVPLRLLERASLFRRKAAGTGQRIQVIAANVDTLLIVTSCNADFNLARLERYLALARDEGVTPVVVITKADMVDDPHPYVDAAAKLMPGLLVECLNARDAEAVAVLRPWCDTGQTVALMGSSGVGKSTLVNTLTDTAIETAAIREADAHGRHTTTARTMHRLAAGGWLLDTPGMRELQLADSAEGVAEVFTDIVDLAASCRFADCAHESEPGCAVQAAIAAGALAADRLERYRKLAREDARNADPAWKRRARERVFGKMAKGVMAARRERREE